MAGRLRLDAVNDRREFTGRGGLGRCTAEQRSRCKRQEQVFFSPCYLISLPKNLRRIKDMYDTGILMLTYTPFHAFRQQRPGQELSTYIHLVHKFFQDRKLIQSKKSNQTALHFTASKNNLETARKLLSHGATARVKDKRGQLPLHRAAAVGSVPMVKLMLENKSPMNATDIYGLTALHHGEFCCCCCCILCHDKGGNSMN